MAGDVKTHRGLTRDLVVDAALRAADEGGLEAVSLRRLAGGLEVTPMAIYGQGAAGKSTSLASFHSPTGNISCRLSAASVRCQSRQRPHSVTMNGSGQLTICRGARCLGNPAAGAATLGYGGRTTVGRFTCRSAFSGLTCTVTSSGRGFVINKDGVRRVG